MHADSRFIALTARLLHKQILWLIEKSTKGSLYVGEIW